MHDRSYRARHECMHDRSYQVRHECMHDRLVRQHHELPYDSGWWAHGRRCAAAATHRANAEYGLAQVSTNSGDKSCMLKNNINIVVVYIYLGVYIL